MKDYLKNFESLCSGTPYTYSQSTFVDFRQRIESLNYFESVRVVDNTRTKETADVLSLFFREVLQQPYYYIEALKSYPNDEIKQGQYLYDCIELAKDRFFSAGRGFHRVKNQLKALYKTDRPAAQQLYNEILFIVDDFLHNDIGTLSNTLDFNLKESPLFVELMKHIQKIKEDANMPYIPIPEPPRSAQAARFSELWYGITYKILQCIGVEKQFIESTDKAGIMQFGKIRYKLETNGQVFYKRWKAFEFNNIPVEVKNFPKKDRKRWKEIVLTISENRAEVELWLNKQVN